MEILTQIRALVSITFSEGFPVISSRYCKNPSWWCFLSLISSLLLSSHTQVGAVLDQARSGTLAGSFNKACLVITEGYWKFQIWWHLDVYLLFPYVLLVSPTAGLINSLIWNIKCSCHRYLLWKNQESSWVTLYLTSEIAFNTELRDKPSNWSDLWVLWDILSLSASTGIKGSSTISILLYSLVGPKLRSSDLHTCSLHIRSSPNQNLFSIKLIFSSILSQCQKRRKNTDWHKHP